LETELRRFKTTWTTEQLRRQLEQNLPPAPWPRSPSAGIEAGHQPPPGLQEARIFLTVRNIFSSFP